MPESSRQQFVLDDFAIESAELKKDHKEKLANLAFDMNHTIGISSTEFWLITLVGSASQSGSDAYNLALSKKRAEAVQQDLDRRLIGVRRRYRVVAIGEAGPVDSKIFENAKDRAVGVHAQLVGRLPPRIVPLDPDDFLKPRPIPRKDFTLQVMSFIIQSVGVPLVHVGRIAMNFTVNDGSTTARYTFMGEGGGIALGARVLGGSHSAKRGAPQNFLAPAMLRAGEFAGKAQFNGPVGAFLFGGHARRAVRGLHDFPMGAVLGFKLPPAIGKPALGMVFNGEVTKGFDPEVPEAPGVLPPDIFD